MPMPAQPPTHAEIDLGRVAAMGLELDELADGGDRVELAAVVELADDRGRPASHYVAAIALATDLRIASTAKLELVVCAGNCQRYGALDVIEHAIPRAAAGAIALRAVTCLDRCAHAPACELRGPAGTLVLAPVTTAALDEAIAAL
jgi:hypothetical protein|nr:hypothetical protein [Kofleriaceae bacterium]